MVVGIELTLIGAAYGLFSSIAQRKLVNQKRSREIQGNLKRLQKELIQIPKNDENEHLLAAKQKEMMELFSESTRSMIKPTLIILPAFYIMYYFLLPSAFPTHPIVSMPFSFPAINLFSFTLAKGGPINFGYQFYFILISIVITILIGAVIARLEAMKMKKEQSAQQNTQQAENKTV